MKSIISIAVLSATFNSLCFAQNIGTVTAKGIFFKDSIKVKSFDDPDISGVACYTTKYTKGGSFESSSSTSLSCRQVGPIKGKLIPSKNVFSQTKGFFGKKTVVARMIDLKRNVLVYLSYTKAMSGKNSSHSISVVPVKKWANQ